MSVKINSTGGGSVTLDSGSTANNVTLNLPGTAGTVAALASVTNNGVAYVNSSGQPTSGSALTFDGSALWVAATGQSSDSLAVNGFRIGNGTFKQQFAAGYDFQQYYTAAGQATPQASMSADTGAWIVKILSAEQMRLNSTGLGIGTGSPQYKLHVQSTDVSSAIFSSRSTGAAYLTIGNITDNTLGLLYSTGSDFQIRQRDANSNSKLTFWTQDSEKMRIDASGNVGIGTSGGLGTKLTVQYDQGTSALFTGNVSYGTGITLQNTHATGNTGVFFNNNSVGQWAIQSLGDTRAIRFYDIVSSAERMRIDSSGNLLVNTTSSTTYRGNRAWLNVVGTGSTCAANFVNSTPGAQTIGIWNQGDSGTRYFIEFSSNSGSGLTVGAITSNGTSTTYGTASDYRLKENIQPMQNALDVVQQLNPVTYTWKADGSDGQGFIAHELQAVVPDCVTGEKDAIDEEGNPVYQGVDTSFLVATLTKAIQELSAKVDAQAAEIAALKAK